MELQDLLRHSNWSVQAVSDKLAPSTNAKTKFVAPKKKSVKRHEARENHIEDSDSEGEYNDSNVVFDSDSENEEMNEWGEEDEENLSDDKRRVLNFFNNGTNHELAAIQGCSKKKVENIVELRPFTGWGDLVSDKLSLK